MLTIRRSETRGHIHHSWLESYHSFSFADYYDPNHIQFSQLRVINEDKIAPAKGFATHSHQDMEIITYIIAGTLEHKDSMGNKERIHQGDIQRMTAGSGITHSEYNASDTQKVHLLQIWIHPNQKGITPSYEQKHYSQQEKINQLKLVVSPDGEDNSICLHQDAYLYASIISPKHSININLAAKRKDYLHIVQGRVDIKQEILKTGDALLIEEENITLNSQIETEILFFDLPS